MEIVLLDKAILAVMDHERNEGRAEGRKEGRAEGRMQEKLANALSLKQNGVPVEIIAKSLGLSVAEVHAL